MPSKNTGDVSAAARAAILPARSRRDRAASLLDKRRRDITKDGAAYAAAFVAYVGRRVLETACGDCWPCHPSDGGIPRAPLLASPHACKHAIAIVAARFQMPAHTIKKLAARCGTFHSGTFDRGMFYRRWPEFREITEPYDTHACDERLAEFQAWEAERAGDVGLRQLNAVVASFPTRAEAAARLARERAELLLETAERLAELASEMRAEAEVSREHLGAAA